MKHPAVQATRRALRAALSDRLAAGAVSAGDLVLAAVSGGADSLALAAALAWEAPRLGLRAGAVVVDHALQPDSAAVAGAAACSCRDLGLDPVVVERVDVGRGGGPEAAARAARYAAIDAVAERVAAQAVLLAHTLDDQAETVLLGLARGSGSRSLAGMAAVDGRRIRPLLSVRRAQTVEACAALGLQPWQDPHNLDRRFARARVRHDVLPLLEHALGPGVAEALARSALLLREDADAIDTWADGVGGAELDVRALGALPAAVRRRILRRAAVAAGAPAGSVSAVHVRELERLVVDWRGQGEVSLPGGFVGERRCDRLTFR